jgi:hypothetical protein
LRRWRTARAVSARAVLLTPLGPLAVDGGHRRIVSRGRLGEAVLSQDRMQ